MSLQVIGAGFGRTGTLSMKLALESLGYTRTHHMQEVAKSRTQVKLWSEVADGQPPRWDEIFSGFKASVDFPSSTYYRELMEHFPDAKVVLTTRDVDKWYASTASTIYPLTTLIPSWMIRVIPPVRQMNHVVVSTVWQRVFDGRFEDAAHAKQVFVDYEAEVQRTVPADRLLVFNVAEGWEPLCAFLDCDVPDRPFPHLNDAASFPARHRALRALGAAPYVAGAGVAAVLARSMIRRAQ